MQKGRNGEIGHIRVPPEIGKSMWWLKNEGDRREDGMIAAWEAIVVVWQLLLQLVNVNQMSTQAGLMLERIQTLYLDGCAG